MIIYENKHLIDVNSLKQKWCKHFNFNDLIQNKIGNVIFFIQKYNFGKQIYKY